jgi:hypothetical protein
MRDGKNPGFEKLIFPLIYCSMKYKQQEGKDVQTIIGFFKKNVKA